MINKYNTSGLSNYVDSPVTETRFYWTIRNFVYSTKLNDDFYSYLL